MPLPNSWPISAAATAIPARGTSAITKWSRPFWTRAGAMCFSIWLPAPTLPAMAHNWLPAPPVSPKPGTPAAIAHKTTSYGFRLCLGRRGNQGPSGTVAEEQTERAVQARAQYFAAVEGEHAGEIGVVH